MKDVVLENIMVSYNKSSVRAVDSVSLEIEKGELFGLIGPDGAGKTSLFRVLTTLLLADGGKASVHNFDVVKDYKEIRKIVGYMPGKFSLYQDLTVEENLSFFATVFGTTIQENYDLIKEIYIQLEPFKNRRAGKLSGGMKQKLALCCALIHRPKVLFLDEPTTGVDAVSRREFWEMLQRLKKQGITILVSTPYMDEAMLCERIGLIQNGKIMKIDSPQAIVEQYPYPLYSIKSNKMGKLLNDLRQIDEVQSCNAFGEYHHITLTSQVQNSTLEPKGEELENKSLKNVIQTLEKHHEHLEVKPTKPTIEDCFIQLMST